MSESNCYKITGLNNCGGRCQLYAHVTEGRITGMTTEQSCGEGQVPLCACAKGLNYHKTFSSSERLLYPMIRTGKRGEGRFRRISWEEAVDHIAQEWVRIRDRYGPGSRYVNYATGMSGVLDPEAMAKRLLALDGGYLDRYNSYSTACISQATDLIYGTRFTGNPPRSWLDSKLIILWGHNPADTRFDSETMYYLRKSRQQGTPVVVVDPRLSSTVRALDAEWIPIRPSTDAAMLDAMAYEIYFSGLHDQDFLDRCCLGFDKEHMPDDIDPSECCVSYLLGEQDGIVKNAEWAEKITGVPAQTIRDLALRYASAKPAALIQGYGAQRHAYGEQSARGAMLLACMTGNVGVWGGWAAGNGYCQLHERPTFPRLKNPFPMSIPVYSWTAAVEDGGSFSSLDGLKGGDRLPSGIKMILNLAGNCLINQHGDINRTAKILEDTTRCELIICSDLFMTPSAKYADILLPGVSPLERNDISMPWQYGEFLSFSQKAIDPPGEARLEYDWLSDVADRLGLREAFTLGCSADDWLCRIYGELRQREPELPPFDIFSECGTFRYSDSIERAAFEQECRDPIAHPFPTESGLIELFSPGVYRTEYRDYFPAVPRYVDPPEGPEDPFRSKYPLQLVGWHTNRRTHSTHDNNPDLRGIEPQQLWIHPSDASSRQICDGDTVLVWNQRGKMQILAKVTDRVMPGVTALSQGAWYSPDEYGTDHGGCINVLTSLNTTPHAKGNAQHTNLVEVRKV